MQSSILSKLVAYYKLDETSGNAVDSLALNNLTNFGPASFSPGKINNGVDFGALNNTKYLYNPTNLGITGGPCSISLLYKAPPALASGQINYVAMNGDNGTQVGNHIWYFNNAGITGIWFNRQKQNIVNDAFIYKTPLVTNQWYHLVYTYDGTTVRGYVDGVFVGSINTTGNGSSGMISQTAVGGYFAFGSFIASSANMTDETGIFNAALTQAEITYINNGGLIRSYPFAPNSSFLPRFISG